MQKDSWLTKAAILGSAMAAVMAAALTALQTWAVLPYRMAQAEQKIAVLDASARENRDRLIRMEMGLTNLMEISSQNNALLRAYMAGNDRPGRTGN